MDILHKWELKKTPQVNNHIKSQVIENYNVSEVFCELLSQKGLSTLEDIELFLNSSLKDLPLLEEWPNLKVAAEMISRSIENNEKIAIWGDYDADGITSTALLYDFFRKRIGKKVEYFLPHRMHHGYGMKKEVVEELHNQGVNMIITVDCGISNIDEIKRAKELGMKVVLTDHHLPGKTLPEADIIINPKVNDTCKAKELAGVGVAFYLAAQLNHTLPGEKIDIRQFLDLVALGTIADIVDLDITNRILVKNGLKILATTKRPGFVALKTICGIIAKNQLDVFDVGFILGPRINASGRMDSPELAFDMLTEENHLKAMKKAVNINSLNEERKKIEEKIVEEAVKQAEAIKDNSSIVVYNENWHLGVVGIVASRLVDKFGKPCFVLGKKNGVYKGSGRSIPGYHLFDILTEIKDDLSQFGGHSQAAGVSVAPEKILDFQKSFSEECSKIKVDESVLAKQINLPLDLQNISKGLIEDIDKLHPFGPCNEKPVFLSSPLIVVEQRLIGEGKHLGFELADSMDNKMVALLWRQGEKWGADSLKGKKIIVSFYPDLNIFNGIENIQIIIDEILAVENVKTN